MRILSIIILVFFVASTSYLMFGKLGIPEGLTAVKPFDINRFSGTWYEVARLDHGFEKGLSHVTANYTVGKDGNGIQVLNKAFNAKTNRWESSLARVAFIDQPDEGRLKVSFFGPFYGSYNIIDLDQKDYSYAMVTGPGKQFFWILSRKPTLDNKAMQTLIKKAIDMGFKLEKIVYVDQRENTAPPENAAPATAPSAPAPAKSP